MALYQIARYQVRPEACAEAERAMRELADRVRAELADTSWTAYRDRDVPGRYLAFIRADDAAAVARYLDAPVARAFAAALAPLLAGPLELGAYELVTSSDLQRRAPPARSTRRPRPR
jgi:quinol monooxygenase YgiN